ncbi:MAG: phosphatidylglycerophosphatase A [Candidatus Sulfobium sp.]
MRAFVRLLLKNVATLGFVGYMPFAPGTWGSAAGLLFVSSLDLSPVVQFLVITSGIVVGIISSDTAEDVIGERDSGKIVIDEFIGYLVAVFYVPHTYVFLIAGFLLFRIFDILKPFPINRIDESMSGGLGIMADDLLAGIYAGILLRLWTVIF